MSETQFLPAAARGAVLTVGTFDGVHRGHTLVLERTAERARAQGLASLAVTFDPHPLDVVNPSAAPPLLTLWDEKIEILAQTSIEYVTVVPFTRELAALTAEEFVERVLIRSFGMRELLIGYDHGFGRGRGGDVESLRVMGRQWGFPVDVIAPVLGSDDAPISSTTIRRAIAHGDLARAADGLGRRYSVSGQVVSGERRGRLLGFPTLNLGLAPPRKLLPPHGVYAVRVEGKTGAFGGMMNLGPRPTFDDDRVSMEVHVFDASGDWYGGRVHVEFVTRLRDTRRFAGPAELVAQLQKDAESARSALTGLVPAAKLKGSGTNTSSLR